MLNFSKKFNSADKYACNDETSGDRSEIHYRRQQSQCLSDVFFLCHLHHYRRPYRHDQMFPHTPYHNECSSIDFVGRHHQQPCPGKRYQRTYTHNFPVAHPVETRQYNNQQHSRQFAEKFQQTAFKTIHFQYVGEIIIHRRHKTSHTDTPEQYTQKKRTGTGTRAENFKDIHRKLLSNG